MEGVGRWVDINAQKKQEKRVKKLMEKTGQTESTKT